jgi:gluconolactonase
MRWKAEVLARGLSFPEGPVYVGPGEVVFTEISAGQLRRWRDGSLQVVARTGGGPNGATVGADGSLYVANNGGLHPGPGGIARADDGVTGRIQRVLPAGEVRDVTVALPGAAPHRPNDLCFGPDGKLYFTDPHNWEDFANLKPGRVNRTDLSGRVETLASVERFPNGIGFGADGRLYVAESISRRIWVYDWSPAGLGPAGLFCELSRGMPDGFCFDRAGSLIVCGAMEDSICVLDPEGALRERFDAPSGAHPTNCCIGGGRLWVTYSGTGELVAFDYPVEAQPLFTGRGR